MINDPLKLQIRLEEILTAFGFHHDDEYEENGVLFVKYSIAGLGVRFERNKLATQG